MQELLKAISGRKSWEVQGRGIKGKNLKITGKVNLGVE